MRPSSTNRSRAPTAGRLPCWIVLILAGTVAAAGCGEPEPAAEEGLTRTQFVDVVVAIRNAEIDLDVPDSLYQSRFEEKRDSILGAFGVAEEELYEFLDRHPDAQYQNELWDTITQRLKRPAETAEEGLRPVK